ncbi:SRPBCC family protein [Lederbergia lenta]|uniref:Cyclase/dehydrase n=1 Tax=Lederbergia lenta TaxID=1467 RepID=A0A2X4VXU2_LEDLE|nr:SRPBCC family protein [Lederbergia lenta]MEC2323774.1 SRPBCC family protein [Lederbergia lenta]SQI51462.1 cyclase/dehydrase [Lederbergia lenta]
MPIIRHEQFIRASVNVCFDLARNVNIHTKTTSNTKEIIVGGVSNGLLEEGDTVTWEAVHFGVKQRLTAKVIQMEKPNMFVDIMLKGAFSSFIHTHQFVEKESGTLMIDTFDYTSPFGFIGIMADKLFLEKYMREFIISRAKELKKIAEDIN